MTKPKKHTLISFLAECEQEILSCQPDANLHWNMRERNAYAYIGYVKENTHALALANQLKELGWKRSSTSGTGPWWAIRISRAYASGTENEFFVSLEGMATERLDGRPYDAKPFFAPPRPALPNAGRPSQAWEEENAEWERKTANHEW